MAIGMPRGDFDAEDGVIDLGLGKGSDLDDIKVTLGKPETAPLAVEDDS